MAVAPFSENYSKGTHFSDGVRVGPIYGTSYSTGPGFTGNGGGGNFATPTPVETPADQLRNPGVLLGPTYTYFITPYASSPSCLFAAAQTPNAMNFLGLLAPTFANGGTAIPLPQPVTLTKGVATTSVTKGYVFDVPRCVSVTTAEAEGAILIAYGYDAYGFPVVSQLTLGAAVGLYVFPKAMKMLLGIYSSGQTAANIMIGISDVFGLPYRIDNASQITANWAGWPLAQTNGFVGPQASIAGALGVNTILFTKGVAGTGTNFSPASPAPFAVGNIPPAVGSVSSAITNDVRGLIAVPTQSNFTYQGGGMSAARQLVVQMYLPNANSAVPQVYGPNDTRPTNNPIDVAPAIGTPVLVPTTPGGLSYAPLYGPTLPAALYGYPQYNTDVAGTPFNITT